MATVSIQDVFLGDVMLEVSGCLDLVIIDKIRAIIIQFCERTGIWREDLDQLYVMPGITDYTLSAPAADSAIVRLAEVKLADTGLAFDGYVFSSPDAFTLKENPNQELILSMKGVLKPTRTCSNVPDIFLNDWFEAVTAGAKYTLMAMQGKPWANSQGASYYLSRYEANIRQARIRINAEGGEKRLFVRARRFV